MISIYYGKDVQKDDADALVGRLSLEFPDLEVACYYGGQPHYFYIISAE